MLGTPQIATRRQNTMQERDCDLSRGSFEADSHGEYCHQDGPYHADNWNLFYRDGQSNPSIRISDTQVSVTLKDGDSSVSQPFTVTNSTVVVSLSGSSVLAGDAGVFMCLGGSNITFIGCASSSLNVSSKGLAPAIGTNEWCGRLVFESGSFDFETENGLGSGLRRILPPRHRWMRS
jgi:hypothetical protein